MRPSNANSPRRSSIRTQARRHGQFSPKNVDYDKKVSWKEYKSVGPQDNALEFQTMKPGSIKMDLFFDTTGTMKKNGQVADVRTVWVNNLLEMTYADVKAADRKRRHNNEAKKRVSQRPPIVTFGWGDFQMTGGIDSIKVSYLMFARGGTPMRAKVTLTMKEWKPEQHKYNKTSLVEDPIFDQQLVKVRARQTITAVTEANGIENPLENIFAGMALVT